MSVWRYTAIPMQRAEGATRQCGELAAESAAEVRASLRRIGLQVIDLRPVKHLRWRTNATGWLGQLQQSVVSALHHYFRGRRQHLRAELYDSLATMLDSGLPLLEAVDTLVGSTAQRRFSSLRSMLVQVREPRRGRPGRTAAIVVGTIGGLSILYILALGLALLVL